MLFKAIILSLFTVSVGSAFAAPISTTGHALATRDFSGSDLEAMHFEKRSFIDNVSVGADIFERGFGDDLAAESKLERRVLSQAAKANRKEARVNRAKANKHREKAVKHTNLGNHHFGKHQEHATIAAQHPHGSDMHTHHDNISQNHASLAAHHYAQSAAHTQAAHTHDQIADSHLHIAHHQR